MIESLCEMNSYKHKSHQSTAIMTCWCEWKFLRADTFLQMYFIKTTHTHTQISGEHIWDTTDVCVCVLAQLATALCVCVCLVLRDYLSVCLSVWLGYLLQIASASSEPSAHSGSPSQRHLAGTHWPFLQAKSVVAHVFFAVETKVKTLPKEANAAVDIDSDCSSLSLFSKQTANICDS